MPAPSPSLTDLAVGIAAGTQPTPRCAVADGSDAPPVRIGIVGLNFGRKLIEKHVIKGPSSRFLAVAGVTSLDPDEARRTADAWQVEAYPSLQAMLNDPAIEAVGLWTGPIGRAGLVRQCIEAGKHVLTTKPFDIDPQAAQSVLEQAREAGIVVHANSPSPLPSPALRIIEQWRGQHDLGRPVGARRESVDSYHEQADGTWKDNPDQCPVAPIFRLGIYGINEMLRLLGRPARVQVMATRIRTGRPLPDNATLNIEFDGGAIGSLFHSFCVRDGQAHCSELKVYFERGSVVVRGERTPSGTQRKITLYRGSYSDPIIETNMLIDEVGQEGGYGWATFRDAVRAAKARRWQEVVWGAPPELVGASLRIIQAMRRSERSGCIEAVR